MYDKNILNSHSKSFSSELCLMLFEIGNLYRGANAMDNLKEIKPNIMTAVPRLYEKVYDKIIAKGMDLTGVKKMLVDSAVNTKINNLEQKGN